jgi:hypothetical protein
MKVRIIPSWIANASSGLTDRLPAVTGVLLRFTRAALKLIGAWLAIFVALALCIEGVTRLVFPYVPPSPKDYRSARPPAYQNSPFFSQAFVDEAFAHQAWVVLPERRLIYPGDYHGRWFNVENGIRRTVNSPATDHHILLVGSSTVYGAEVPDDYTIASYLQKRINEQGGGKFAVQNLGASGVTVTQQLERLKTLPFGERDVVVFYDGAADAVQGVMYAKIDGWIVEENRKHVNDFVVKHRAQLERLARYCRFCDWLFVQTTDYLPEHMKHPERIKALAVETRETMFSRLLQTDEYVRSRGARFIHVLQPDLFSRPLRDFERPLVENHFLTMKGMGTALLEAHRELAPLTQMLVDRKVRAYDATRIFDQVDEPLYFDFAHTNELGNRMIADFLFDVLVREGVVAGEGAATASAPAGGHER